MSFSSERSWERTKQLAAFPEHLFPYYRSILKDYEIAINTAEKARQKGLDSNSYVESKTVFDLADRVNQMLGLHQFEGIDERLRSLLYSTSKELAALTIAEEIALGKFGEMKKEVALEYGVRAGLAVITDGVTVAPIQGIYSVPMKKNDDGTTYASISYAGPMRSAGGTEAAFSLIIGDVVAKKLGLSNYKPRQEEIGRYIEELRVYEREVGNFQYRVGDEDVRLAISNLPIEIDGVETNPIEVVVHRGLGRVSTDSVRGGALRVLNDGVIGRAHKLAKMLAQLNITGWEWLTLLKGGKQQQADDTEKIGAHFEEVISGRAVLSSHNAKGGFRIRYGRAMNTGFSTVGIHPALTVLLDYPVVVGTQVKVDLPGKAATIAFVDSIEGPTVLLRDGSVRRINSIQDADAIKNEVSKILDLGDALVTYGDFLENNKELSPSPYVDEWWKEDLKVALSRLPEALAALPINQTRLAELISKSGKPITPDEAIAISEVLNIPLHPVYSYRFENLSVSELTNLIISLKEDGCDVIADITSHHIISNLQSALIPYQMEENHARLSPDPSVIIKRLLLSSNMTPKDSKDSLDYITRLSGITVRKQSTATMGMRVGRPEKAMLRHMKPPVHVLFPVGPAGGTTRDLRAAAKEKTISIDVANIICPSCGKRQLSAKCDTCDEATTRFVSCPSCGQVLEQTGDQTCPSCKVPGVVHSSFIFAIKPRLDLATIKSPDPEQRPIKGVRGLASGSKVPEAIEKGVLRSKHDISVYKDGTIRIDLTNAPLTHFRPRDIQTSLESLRRIGYETDNTGAPLTSLNQVVELKPQDIVIPTEVGEDLLHVAQFIDEELRFFYGLEPVYNTKTITDLVGKIVVGLAPHTSVGVIGRIIGFTNAQVCFGSPCWHASKRRDCDGDGDSLLLLLDVFLNFSAEYLPDQIGGLMDTPLLVQPVMLPREVDDQAHNFDVAASYQLGFYENTQSPVNPSVVLKFVDTIKKRLEGERQFYDFGFTHDTSSITIKRSRSAYSTLKSLNEKISKQIEVAEKISAVSSKDVVESIIKTHLLRDIQGNMRKYCGQSFKCRKCERTFRRTTVSGNCDYCGSSLKETLTRASVEKYLMLAKGLADRYNVDDYVKNRLELAVEELDELFQKKERSAQLVLTDF